MLTILWWVCATVGFLFIAAHVGLFIFDAIDEWLNDTPERSTKDR